MADDPTNDGRLQAAVEGLYEDERLRQGLEDDAAARLLGWGEARLTAAAAAPPPRRGRRVAATGGFDAVVKRVQAALRAIADLTSERVALDDAAFGARLAALGVKLSEAEMGQLRDATPAAFIEEVTRRLR